MAKFDGVSGAGNTQQIFGIGAREQRSEGTSQADEAVVQGAGQVGAEDELSPDLKGEAKPVTANASELEPLIKTMQTVVKKLENDDPPEWDPEEGRYDNISYNIDHLDDFNKFDEAYNKAVKIISQLDKSALSIAEHRLCEQVYDVRHKLTESRQRSILNAQMNELIETTANSTDTRSIVEGVINVRNRIIGLKNNHSGIILNTMLSEENMTGTEIEIMNIARDVISSPIEPQDHPAYRSLSNDDREKLELVCGELHRSDPMDKKRFSNKEIIYIVKNAYNDFGLKDSKNKQLAALVDIAVREHLYNDEQQNDSYYMSRQVTRIKNSMSVTRSDTYKAADSFALQNARKRTDRTPSKEQTQAYYKARESEFSSRNLHRKMARDLTGFDPEK